MLVDTTIAFATQVHERPKRLHTCVELLLEAWVKQCRGLP